MTYPDGYRYEGDWVEGRRHGQGTATYADGTVYRAVRRRRARGPGHDHHARGLHLHRRLEGGEINGMGVATYANGDVYEGMFVNGRRQGEGTIRFASGETATGTWVDGALGGTSAAPEATDGAEAGRPPHRTDGNPAPRRRALLRSDGGGMSDHDGRTTTDHDTIRAWAEARGGRPGPGGRTGEGKEAASSGSISRSPTRGSRRSTGTPSSRSSRTAASPSCIRTRRPTAAPAVQQVRLARLIACSRSSAQPSSLQ
jgi:hypothetical protein